MVLAQLDQFNFHHTLEETAGVSLVYFTSPACGACKHLHALFKRHPEQFSQWHFFEIDAQRESALVNEFEVFHLPALFLYVDGHFQAAIEAEPLPNAIVAAVEAAMAAPAMEAP